MRGAVGSVTSTIGSNYETPLEQVTWLSVRVRVDRCLFFGPKRDDSLMTEGSLTQAGIPAAQLTPSQGLLSESDSEYS